MAILQAYSFRPPVLATRLRESRRHNELPLTSKAMTRGPSHGPRNPSRKSHRKLTNMKLRKNELCPIHKSRICCGRGLRRSHKLWTVLRRIEDSQHPRGYRELRSPAEMRKLLQRKILEQNMQCGICDREFTDCDDIVPDHIKPRGLGGGKRDDHSDNIQAAHRQCNLRKGSKRS